MLILLFAGLVGLITTEPSMNSCEGVMKQKGISNAFAPVIAHAIHSLTVEDIKYYFKPDVTEDNFIPTVNKDLTSEERVLDHAPEAGYDKDWVTIEMQHFDSVMKKMNETDYDIANFWLIEKLTHKIHMAEVWARTQIKYKMLEKILDADSRLCTCVNDVDNNGVRAYLQYLAFKIRYPGITTGNDTFTDLYVEKHREKRAAADDDDDDDDDHNDPFYGFCNQGASTEPDCTFRSKLVDFDFNRIDAELLEEVATQLVDTRTQVMSVHLDSPEHWEFWKKTMRASMSEDGYYDLAVFMYCKLN